jgi:signal transduction histidine kinase
MKARRPSLTAWLLVLYVTGARPVAGSPAASAAQVSQPRAARTSQASILILAIDDFTRPYVRLIFEGFSDVVSAAPDPPVLYFENIDNTRFEDARYAGIAREWLAQKYRGRSVDLIVPLGEDALGFLVQTHGRPWPAAKVLFLEVGGVKFDLRRDLPQAGGLVLADHTPEAFRTIRKVLPATRRLALFHGASTVERMRYARLPDTVRAAGFEPIALTGNSLDDVLAAAGRLPADTVVLLLAPLVSASGEILAPREACQRLAAAGHAPVFTLAAHDLGCGAVGGAMRDWTLAGRRLGEEALARLRNASTAMTPVPAEAYTTMAFDDRQLRRWGIPDERLPAGAAIRFRSPSLWRDYRGTVLGVIAITLLQTVLIGGLVWEHRRRRRAEIDARRNLTAMAHLDRRVAMGELATSLAHELNQPLNAILQNVGAAQLMLTAHAVPAGLGELPDIIDDIHKDDVRASEVIRRMRGLLERHEIERGVVDINDVVEDTVAVVRSDARARVVNIDLELASTLPQVMGDRVHLQQVLLNLLLNAVEAVSGSTSGRRQVRVSTTANPREVRVAVSDTGAGISPDHLGRIFEPFYTTKSGSGMGMGLAIARSIVEAHAGQMGASNNPGGGATVWFNLPARDASHR